MKIATIIILLTFFYCTVYINTHKTTARETDSLSQIETSKFIKNVDSLEDWNSEFNKNILVEEKVND